MDPEQIDTISIYREAIPGVILNNIMNDIGDFNCDMSDILIRIKEEVMASYDQAVCQEFAHINHSSLKMHAEYGSGGYQEFDGDLTMHLKNGSFSNAQTPFDRRFAGVIVRVQKSDTK